MRHLLISNMRVQSKTLNDIHVPPSKGTSIKIKDKQALYVIIQKKRERQDDFNE